MLEVNEPRNGLVLLTGGTGAVGPRVAEALDAAGYCVRILTLDPPEPGLLPERIEVRIGDVTDPMTVKRAMEGSGFVVHLAALLHIVNPPERLRKRYEEINVGGTSRVVEAAVEMGVKRIIFSSTIAVYGKSGGQILTEETTPHPMSLYGQTKLRAEQMVLAARKDDQPLGTVLRLADVYGSRLKGNYRRLLQALAHHRFIPVGPGENRRTLVYDRDVARAIILAIKHPAAGGNIYNVSDGEFHTVAQILETMCKWLGRKPPHLSLPIGPVGFMAGFLEAMAGMAGLKSPIGRATVEKYTQDVAISSQRIQKDLGFVAEYDLSTGWRETIQEMRQAGAL